MYKPLMVSAIYAREASILIVFVWNGKRYRETLRLAPTPANLKYADRLRGEILRKIELGNFDLAEYFPESKKAEIIRCSSPTFGALTKQWLLSIRHLAPASVQTYEKRLNTHILPKLAERKISEITYSELAALFGEIEWKSMRTRNNVLIPVRGIFEAAFLDGIIEVDPTARLRNLKFQKPSPDPLTLDEVEKVIKAMTSKYDQQVANYFEFAFFTGMRTSELIALKWGDIDFSTGIVTVQRAKVVGEEKDTKTANIRDVELNSWSSEAIRRQKAFTFLADKEVFHNPTTGKPWHDDRAQRVTYWSPTLKSLGMRARDAYQTRHTFATLNLMAGANPMWVSRQMGHANMKMLLEVYSRWIDQADRSRERNKLEMLKNVTTTSQQKTESSNDAG